MVLTVLQVLLTAVCVLQAVWQTIDYARVLQRRSYVPDRYKKWMLENEKRVLPNTRFLSIAALAILMMFGFESGGGAVAANAAALVLCFISACADRPKKAKKPLVYSSRIKRLLATVGVVNAVLLALSFVWPPLTDLLPDIVINDRLLTELTMARSLPAMLLLIVVLPPYMVLFANFLNSAVEKRVEKGLIKDARRKIADHPKLTVIGVTGSYGKTDMKTYLAALLGEKYNMLVNPETHSTALGIAYTVKESLKDSHEMFVCEMGVKCRGEVKAIGEILRPHHAIITAIGSQHLSVFKTMEAIIDTNFEIVDVMHEGGKVFINTDNDYIASQTVDSELVISYGLYRGADYRATDIVVDEHGTQFTWTAPSGESARYKTTLFGDHAIGQLVGAMAIAHQLGLSAQDMVNSVAKIAAVPHRLQLLDNGFIDDTHNANPDDFRTALDVLGNMSGVRRVLVTPGVLSGEDGQEALNEELGAFAASRCDVAVLVGERDALPLKKGLLGAGFAEEQIFVAMDLHQALCYVQSLPAVDRQIVLLENDPPKAI